VVDGEYLVTLVRRERHAVGVEGVLERVPVHLVERLVGVDLVRDERVLQGPRAPELGDWFRVGHPVGEGGLGRVPSTTSVL